MPYIFQLKDRNRPTSNIMLVISFRGQYYKKSTGETIPPKFWNQKTHRCKVTNDFLDGDYVNRILDKWGVSAQKTIEHFKAFETLPDAESFWEFFLTTHYPDHGKTAAVPFLVFLENHTESLKGVRAENTIKKYVTTCNKIRAWQEERGKQLRFCDINIGFYRDFQKWIYAQGFSANYFGTFVKTIKHVVREAHYQGLIGDFRGIEHRDFVTINELADKIYLSNEEIEALFSLSITPEAIRAEFEEYAEISPENMRRKVESLQVVRERFLIGAYSGLRVSDFSRLEELNFSEKTIKITMAKTGRVVVVPLHENIRKLFAAGLDLDVKISDQKMNDHLKELARLAGIKSGVLISENVSGKNVQKRYRKYELVCTHTARRSFATNALKAGVPLTSISKILGHTKIATTERYLRMSAEEVAESLIDHPFFK